MNNKTIKSKIIKTIIAILILTVIFFTTLSNILNNKTEATGEEVYDVILFWGQSNMTGCSRTSPETRQGTTDAERQVFSEKTGIEKDIVDNIINRGNVKTEGLEGCAYEYILYPDEYVKEDGYCLQNWRQITNSDGVSWTDPHLKPIGLDTLTGEMLEADISDASIHTVKVAAARAGASYDTAMSGSVNMIPEFCSTYYKETGRKVIAVVCSKPGVSIDTFSLTNRNGETNGTYIVMSRKFQNACAYIESKSGMKIGKRMFVSMQGENWGLFNSTEYESYYRNAVDWLKTDCLITNGALVETGGQITNGSKSNEFDAVNNINMSILNTVHTAQENLANKYSDTIIGSRYAYNSYIPNTQTDYEQKCYTTVSYVPGSDTTNPNNRMEYQEAIKHASLRYDYDYAYVPQYSSKISPLVLDAKNNMNYDNNVIHLTSASLCQIGRETARNLAATFDDGRISLSSSTGRVQAGNQVSVTIKENLSGGKVLVASADPTIASIDPSILADSSNRDLVNTTNALQMQGNTIKINTNKAGTTQIWVASEANGLYKRAATCYTITVDQARVDVPTVTNTNFTYNGNTQGPTISQYDKSKISVSGNTAVNAGDYKLRFSLIDPNTYQWADGTTTEKIVDWSIGKAIPTITLPKTSDEVLVGSTKTFTITKSNGAGKVNAISLNSSYATATANSDTITVTGVAEGTTKVNITTDANTNYFEGNTTYTITVKNNVKDISSTTITLDTTEYTYDSTEKTPRETVKDGSKTLTKNADYTVSYSNNKDAGTATVTITGKGNYAGTKAVTFTITKRTLIVTATSKSKKYGEDNPELTYTYSGNVNGQVPNFTGNLTTTATKNSIEGTYDIAQGTLNMSNSYTFQTKNYTMSFVKGTMTITKGAQKYLLGDVNQNNSIDVSDILLIQRHIAQQNSQTIANKHPDWKLSSEKITLADTNKNGRIDVADILLVQRYIAAKNSSVVANLHQEWLEL